MTKNERRDAAIRESREAAREYARQYRTTAIAYYQEHSGRWFVREACDPRPDAAEELGRVVPQV